MDGLNFNHLFYFWMVVREGSITAAAAQLRLDQPTISGQAALGERLLVRVGRVGGEIEAIRERVYAITTERRSRHPAIAAIGAGARAEVFA